MLRKQLPIDPPTWVPGPFQPAKQPPGVPTQHQPHLRYYTATGSENLAGLAERFYGNKMEAVRIFNANRAGRLREDKAEGILHSPQDRLLSGTILLIP